MIQTTHTAITTRNPCRSGGALASTSPLRHHKPRSPPASTASTGAPTGQHRKQRGGDTHIIPNGFVRANNLLPPGAVASKGVHQRQAPLASTSTSSLSQYQQHHKQYAASQNSAPWQSAQSSPPTPQPQPNGGNGDWARHHTESLQTTFNVRFNAAELKQRLTPLQYHITQEMGTEKEYSGAYCRHRDHGTYSCVVCGGEVFSSNNKYYSGSGWPAFNDVINANRVTCKLDPVACGSSCGGPVLLPNPKHLRELERVTKRYEVQCSNCAAHLGHLFDDGPKPTGMRYCINSASLVFNKQVPKETDV